MDIQPISGSGNRHFAALAQAMRNWNCGSNAPVTSAEEALRIVEGTQDVNNRVARSTRAKPF